MDGEAKELGAALCLSKHTRNVLGCSLLDPFVKHAVYWDSGLMTLNCKKLFVTLGVKKISIFACVTYETY